MENAHFIMVMFRLPFDEFGNLSLMINMIWLYGMRKMKITCWMKEIKKFDVIEMKMIIDCNKKLKWRGLTSSHDEHGVIYLMTNVIWLWKLNESDKEI